MFRDRRDASWPTTNHLSSLRNTCLESPLQLADAEEEVQLLACKQELQGSASPHNTEPARGAQWAEHTLTRAATLPSAPSLLNCSCLRKTIFSSMQLPLPDGRGGGGGNDVFEGGAGGGEAARGELYDEDVECSFSKPDPQDDAPGGGTSPVGAHRDSYPLIAWHARV